MKIMKAYTDIAQSKRLAEILPLESADIWYSYYGNPKYNLTIAYEGEQWFLCHIRNSSHTDIPCWSLAALLDMLQDNIKIEKTLFDQSNMFTYSILGDDYEYRTNEHENLIDACYEMIVKLNELSLL